MTVIELADYQQTAVMAAARQQSNKLRLCLYYKTGAGKTVTALACIKEAGYDRVIVIAPPSTHPAWEEWASRFGMEAVCMSHAKFRMPGTKFSRTVPMIVDEFHLLGGHNGKGWKKMDTFGLRLEAPLLGLSATPNYNDAERVYCIQHVFDPHSCKGGYLQFLSDHCTLEMNPFSITPDVTGFIHFKDAASYLESLWFVEYLPDDLVYTITDIPTPRLTDNAFEQFGLNRRRNRIMASEIEKRHAIIDHSLIGDDGLLQPTVNNWIASMTGGGMKKALIFANHETVAKACDRTMAGWNTRVALVTGTTPKKKKLERIAAFRDGVIDVLIGTASLATGTDGLDRVCDRLIILDDTDDDSLRRQLIGRIMPRGIGVTQADAKGKQVYRLVLS